MFNGKIHYKWPFSIAMLNFGLLIKSPTLLVTLPCYKIPISLHRQDPNPPGRRSRLSFPSLQTRSARHLEHGGWPLDMENIWGIYGESMGNMVIHHIPHSMIIKYIWWLNLWIFMVYSLYDDEIWWIRGFGIYSMFGLFIIELLGCVFCKRSSFSRGSEKMGTQFIAGNIKWGVWLVTRKRHDVHYKLEIRHEIYDLTIVDKMIKPWWGSSLEELRDATWCNPFRLIPWFLGSRSPQDGDGFSPASTPVMSTVSHRFPKRLCLGYTRLHPLLIMFFPIKNAIWGEHTPWKWLTCCAKEQLQQLDLSFKSVRHVGTIIGC